MIVRLHNLSLCLLAVLLTVSANLSVASAAETDSQNADDGTETVQPQQDELLQLVDSAISITSRRYLSGDVHTPWQIMHGLLALRQDFRIKVDNEKVGALQWLTEGRTYNGLPIIEHSPYGGRFHPFTEPYAFEGHPNQFLAILTMSDLAADFEFTTNVNGTVTIQEMLRNAQMEVNDREEITWTLWALSRYLPVDSEWVNKSGEPWSIERLVQIQTYADPNAAACGGTHGLFALSLARNAALATGQPLRGIWFEADQKIRNYVAQARSLQNSDGSLSSKYFGGPGYSSEFGKRIATSGHVLEFLMVGARDEELQREWLRSAVRSVAQDLVDHRRTAADCGPLYHALHALVLYQQRMGVSAQPEQETLQPEQLADATPESGASAAKPTEPTEATEPELVIDEVEVVEPAQVFVAVEEPATEEDSTEDDAAESDREIPQDETSASIPKPEPTSDGIRGLFETVESDETALVDEAEVVEEPTEIEETIEEDIRTPEDNAPEIRDEPMVMEDGYEVPMPPTMD